MSAGASNRIAKGLGKVFKNTVFTKTGRCIKLDTKHFVEGLIVERTPYKETFYIWFFINPIWARRCLDTLSYSIRIANGRYFIGSPEKVIEEIISEVYINGLYLDRISGPETTPSLFMDTILSEFPRANEHTKLRGQEITFDLGIVLALDNRLDESKKAFETFLMLSHRGQHYFRLCARDIVASFEAEDQAYLNVVSDMEEQGRSLFPFTLRAKQ